MFTGLFLLLLGGICAGSFYIPLKKIRRWSWESGWISNGLFAWIISPLVGAAVTVPRFLHLISGVGIDTVFITWLMGFIWGIGGVTFGLSMRYLGLSLGYALALGSCAAFGTLIPPLFTGRFPELLATVSGQLTLTGIAICLVGVGICGYAGIRKENEIVSNDRADNEFNLPKGIVVALISGLMNAGLAFSFVTGRPIAEAVIQQGISPLWQNNPVLVVALSGGFITNIVYCVFLNIKNKSLINYIDRKSPLLKNYSLSAAAGVLWYLQFMLYGMGTSSLGDYAFAGWSVLMAVIVVVSNVWGVYFKEWQGVSRKTIRIISLGVFVVLLSIVLIGAGSYAAM